MKIGLVSKMFIVGIIFTLLSVLLPNFDIKGLDPILASVTFIFSVLYGFEISVVLTNFSQLKTLLATLNAQLQSLHSLGNVIGGDFKKITDDRVEDYLMSSIDYELIEQNKIDNKFNSITNIFDEKATLNVEANTDAKGQALEFIFQSIYDATSTRNQIKQVAPKFIGVPEWLMLWTLAIIMIGVLFFSRNPDLLSEITSAILATTVIGSLLVLDEIDSNDVQEGFLEYEVFNSTLESMGKENYYPDFALSSGIVKPAKGKSYRVGSFPKYPDLSERTIKERKG